MRKKGMLVLGIMAAATAIGIYFGLQKKTGVTGRGGIQTAPLL